MRPQHRPHSREHRPRHGRILAECIVSLALLAVAVTASLSFSRAALLLTDEARLLVELGATAGAHAEATTPHACLGTGASGAFTAPRVAVTWTDAISPPAAQAVRHRNLNATLRFTPLANRDSAQLAFSAAGVCPW